MALSCLLSLGAMACGCGNGASPVSPPVSDAGSGTPVPPVGKTSADLRGASPAPAGSEASLPGSAVDPMFPPAPPTPVSRRLLVIGIDAADENMIRPLVRSGHLPALARVYGEGATGPLRSHRPMLSPILWTSIATGVGPDRHGVLDFVEPGPAGGPVPIQSTSRRVAAVWDALGRKGIRVAVVGWLATYPALPVNGWLVSDRFTTHPFESPEAAPISDPAGKTWPGDLFQSLLPLTVIPGAVTDEEVRRTFGVNPRASGVAGSRDLAVLRVVLATTRTYAAVAEKLLEKERPAFAAVYFDGVDRLLHIFSDVSETPLAGADPSRTALYSHVVEHYYETIDRTIGELVRAAGPDTTVLIVSDHGWKTGRDRPQSDPRREGPFAAEWHREFGFIGAIGPGIVRGGRIKDADIYDVAPTILAFFDQPAASDFRGRLASSLFQPRFLKPLETPIATYGPPPSLPRGNGSAAGAPGSSREERAALSNLQGLGYISGSVTGSGSSGAATGVDAAAAQQQFDRRVANLATVYLDDGRFSDAADLYRNFIASHGEDYDALYNMAFAKRRMNDPDSARDYLQRAAAARPGAAEPWIAIGELAMAKKDLPAAHAAVTEAGRRDPDAASVWNLRGTIDCETGQIAECQDDFERAIRIDAAASSASLNLSRVLEMKGRKDEAVAVIKKAMAAADSPDERLSRRLAGLQGGDQ